MSCKGKSRTEPHRPLLDRFVDKVIFASEGCWEWTGTVDGSGYGALMTGSRTDGSRRARRASRISYELFVGEIGDNCVLHKCDNRRCVNPEHLFLGDRLANTHDMIAKGRAPNQSGSQNGNAKLNESQVREIRRKYLSGGVSFSSLGREYGVGSTTIGDVVSGKTWPRLRAALEAE